MHYRILIAILITLASLNVEGQTPGKLNAELRALTKENDPSRAIRMKEQIVRKHSIDSTKDSETFDIINGSIALVYARNHEAKGFEHYISLMKNQFNQTSMMNMAATELLDRRSEDSLALRIARETIEKFRRFKDDPTAMPSHFKAEDWQRFMNFAQYPYYDTYARALFGNGNFKDALTFQQMAFAGKPEEGLPASVERYAELLTLNDRNDEAIDLLLKVAAMGRLNKNMSNLLQSFYAKGQRSDKSYDQFLDSLQFRLKENMRNEFQRTMLNKEAPDFTIKNLQGRQVSLSDYKGKIVVLDLWATWCAPCIASFPAMQTLVNKHPDVEFLFIAVQEGRNAFEKVKKFMKGSKFSFHVLVDEAVKKGSDKFRVLSAYMPDGIPAKYFIDKQGILQFTSKGFDTDAQLINEAEMMISILREEPLR